MVCQMGRSLLANRHGLHGSISWRWHARSCRDCREIHAAERFLDGYLRRAGSWPLPAALAEAAVSRPSHKRGRGHGLVARARLAAACATFVVLLLAVGVLGGRRTDAGAALAAAARAMGEVRTVHYVGRQQLAGAWSSFDVKMKFPDKRRCELPGQTISIENGDRELLVLPEPTTLPWHLVPYRYVLRHVSELSKRGQDADLFSYPERLRLLARQGKSTRTETVTLDDGTKALLVEVRTDGPDKTSSDIVTIDPSSHLVLGWKTEMKWKTEGLWRAWRAEVDSVEYNTDLSDELFSTEPPAGQEVLDQYSQQGMRTSLEQALEQVESLHGSDRAALVKEINDNNAFWQVSRLAPEAQKPIRERMAKLGLTVRDD